MRVIRWAVALLVCAGCTPSSSEDFRLAGEKISLELCEELGHVHSLEELQSRVPQLKRKMRKLTKLILAADRYYHEHEWAVCVDQKSWVSDRLWYELLRISQEIEGGKEALEGLQAETLDWLDGQIQKNKKS